MRLPHHRSLRWAFALLLVLSALIGAHAQTVRREEVSGSIAREGNNAAEEQNRTDWVDLRGGETGTHVVLSGDFGDADVTIWTNLAFGIEPLLTESQKIAVRLNRPKTDFIVYRGRKTTHGVDLEFNDYLEKRGRSSSSFALNLADLRDALESSSLPRPITVFESHVDGDVTVATLEAPGAKPRRVGETFFALRDIPDGAMLRYETTVPWYGYAILCTAVGVFAILLPYGEWAGFHARRKARQTLRERKDRDETLPDPATVQALYDKQKPIWVYTMLVPGLMLLGMAGVLSSGRFKSGVVAAFAALDALDVPMNWVPLLIPGAVGLVKLIGFLADRAQIKREGIVPVPEQRSEDEPPRWTLIAILYPLPFALLAMSVLVFLPSLRGALLDLSPDGVRYYLGAVGVLTVAAIILINRYARRFTHYSLPEGHPAHAMIAELTGDAKVRVRNVEVVRSTSLNAYVSVWRTVGFTSRLLREFSPEELRVIVAHEVGHFRAADPPRHLLLGLITSAVLIGAWIYGTTWLGAHFTLPREARALLNSPMFSIVFLPVLQNLFLGRTRRRAEEAADRFAVDEMQGDGEFVIQTLTKLHTLNASPHHLKPSDEMLSSHPSLVNRIAAIRRYVAGHADRGANRE